MIVGPSGVGKTTIANELVRLHPELELSVSATTRAPRQGEQDGLQYRFLSRDEFERRRDQGGFYESAEVFGELYGTPREPVERALAEGKTVVLEIDVQGARQVRAARPDAVTIFIQPPSREVLWQRLARRKTESEEALARRIAEAEAELAAAAEFDHEVVNDALADAVADVARILEDRTPRSES